jgi:CRP-like cAMP-binding protein
MQQMVRRFVARLFQRRPQDSLSGSCETAVSSTNLLLSDNAIGDGNVLIGLPSSFQWTLVLWSKLQDSISTWVNTFVIHKSSNAAEEWHFRTLFVAEVTILPFVVMFGLVSFWLLNRNTHLRKTRGSAIPLKGDGDGSGTRDDDDDDEDEEDDSMQHGEDGETVHSTDNPSATAKAPKAQPRSARRQWIQAMLKAYDVEHDDEEASLEDSDCEDDENDRRANSSNSSGKDLVPDSDASMLLSNEKRELWKIVKEIAVFSYFDEEAMHLCMEFVEYVDLKQADDTLWKRGGYDGSLYYVVNGGVRVQFHDFEAPTIDRRGSSSARGGPDSQHQCQRKEPVAFTHGAGTVVTSLLASLEGMVRHHLQGTNSLGRFVGAAMRETSAKAASDGTRLVRVPPACFCRVLERFPDTVLRIIQTVLNRTQRVTVQTLVRTCGLREELLVPPSKEMRECMLPKKDWSSPWMAVQSFLEKNLQSASELDTFSAASKKSFMKDACSVLATILGISDKLTVEALEEQCSLLVVDDGGANCARILQEAGTVHDACYLLLRGSLEMVRIEFS